MKGEGASIRPRGDGLRRRAPWQCPDLGRELHQIEAPLSTLSVGVFRCLRGGEGASILARGDGLCRRRRPRGLDWGREVVEARPTSNWPHERLKILWGGDTHPLGRGASSPRRQQTRIRESYGQNGAGPRSGGLHSTYGVVAPWRRGGSVPSVPHAGALLVLAVSRLSRFDRFAAARRCRYWPPHVSSAKSTRAANSTSVGLLTKP